MIFARSSVFESLFTVAHTHAAPLAIPHRFQRGIGAGESPHPLVIDTQQSSGFTIQGDAFLDYALSEMGAVITILPPQRPAKQVFTTFEEWLEGESGQTVVRLLKWRSRTAPRAVFDEPEDVLQRSLIWLWKRFVSQPTWFGEYNPAYISQAAIRSSKCKYAHRAVVSKIPTEHTAPLQLASAMAVQIPSRESADTSIALHDRGYLHIDRRFDLDKAFRETVIACQEAEMSRKRRCARIDPTPERIATVLQVIYQGWQYHYDGPRPGSSRTVGSGEFRKYCKSQGVRNSQLYKWRKRLINGMSSRLSEYQ